MRKNHGEGICAVFEDVGNSLKSVAKVLLILCIILGIIVYFLSGSAIITSGLIVFGGFILSLLMYGFGEIITILQEINDKLSQKDRDEEMQKVLRGEKILQSR